MPSFVRCHDEYFHLSIMFFRYVIPLNNYDLFPHPYHFCRIAAYYRIVRHIVRNHRTGTDDTMCTYTLATRQYDDPRTYPHIAAYL